MPIAETIGGHIVGQIAFQGGQQAGGGVFSQIGQWGNSIAPSGYIPWDQCRLLHTLGFISPQVWQTVNGAYGMRDGIVDRLDLMFTIQNGLRADLHTENFDRPFHINARGNHSLKYVPSIQELIFLRNRELITDRLFSTYMHINVAGEAPMNMAWQQSRFEIPGPSDLIRFVVRDAFTPQAVQLFEYHKEFPIEIVPWMEKQGYGQNTGVAIPPGATTTQGPDNRQFATWSDLYWWSHWDLPSPTQAFSMFQRFYSQSPYGPSPEYNIGIKFGSDELEMLLKTADYPTYWRKRLTALAYSPLTRVDVRRMYDIGVLGDSGVYHAFRAIGYNDHNAQLLLQFTKTLKEKKENKAFKYITLQDLQFMWDTQILSLEEIKFRLREIGHTNPQVEKIVNGWQIKKKIQELKAALKLVKTAFMDGLFSFDVAINGLLSVGISPVRAGQYLQAWSQDRFVYRRYLSAQAAMDMAFNGIVNENNLRKKLSNLNYGKEEIENMIIRVAQRRNQEFIKQFDKQQKEQAKIKAHNLQTLLKPYSDKNIVTWFKRKMMTIKDVILVLQLKEWRKPAIINWLDSELHISSTVAGLQFEEIENEESSKMDETNNEKESEIEK